MYNWSKYKLKNLFWIFPQANKLHIAPNPQWSDDDHEAKLRICGVRHFKEQAKGGDGRKRDYQNLLTRIQQINEDEIAKQRSKYAGI